MNNKKILSTVTLLLLIFGWGITLPQASANTLSVASAQELVKQTSEHLMATLKVQKSELEAHPERIYPVVKDIVLPHFDFRRMAQFVLGKYWRPATGKQRQRFVDEFRALLVRTYSTALLKYSHEKIRYLPVHGPTEASDTVVRVEILQANGGPAVPMSLHLYNKGGAWKVFDVKIDGVSLITNYRASFASQVRTGGLNQLIEKLAEKNGKTGV
ncbi:MlaC/ttg2D family ABC transporter substrate-binding protein [Nitrosococcus wardiae]|uniref:ABC transporter substrate-binding protein n=1 Tax=Nitrosococcus wardiae TaxID=1814290 RepID=A0A4P7BVS1_9GAMM|nr:ABC transporter substrate-binding protein [Nitrosococcus wardiae]QBQ54133.1 ABC transporter substrate-binding protein [Nitrosococcus wardiae]